MYTINYNQIDNYIAKSKVAKVMGWIFCIITIVAAIHIPKCIIWKLNEKNYTKQYVLSNHGDLFYLNNMDTINVKTIYDTDNELIELDIPDGKTAIMYCSKENINECIYIDKNDSADLILLNPFILVFMLTILIALSIFFTKKRKPKLDKNGNEKTTLDNIYMFFVFLLVMGVGCFAWQFYNIVKYLQLKEDSNLTTATVFSEIYRAGNQDTYIPISYYYVNDQLYIYENDLAINGNIEEKIGTTFELYYNENDPSDVIKKDDAIHLQMLLIGIVCIAISFPFVFFKRKMERRINKNMTKVKDPEWKI